MTPITKNIPAGFNGIGGFSVTSNQQKRNCLLAFCNIYKLYRDISSDIFWRSLLHLSDIFPEIVWPLVWHSLIRHFLRQGSDMTLRSPLEFWHRRLTRGLSTLTRHGTPERMQRRTESTDTRHQLTLPRHEKIPPQNKSVNCCNRCLKQTLSQACYDTPPQKINGPTSISRRWLG